MMNLFESLQMLNESNSVKIEGIFGTSKKKQQQYDEEIKKIFKAPTVTVSLKISGWVVDVMHDLLTGDEKNAKQAVVKMLKVSSNELKKSPRKTINDIVRLGDKSMCSAADDLKEYVDKIQKEIRHIENIGLAVETYLYEKIGEQLVKKIDILKKKQFESAVIKDEKDIEQIVESTELRQFTGRDHMTWGGEHDFADGSKPLIADGEFATILVGQSDDQVGTEAACISIYYGDPEADNPHWGFKIYDDKESAIKDARLLTKLVDDEIDEAQLLRFGFEIVM